MDIPSRNDLASRAADESQNMKRRSSGAWSDAVRDEERALAELLRGLRVRRYEFTVVTPATHSRVLARPWAGRATLRDIFGWNRPFAARDLDPELLHLLEAADGLFRDGKRLRSRLRVASLGGELLLHSSFPTDRPDAVFLGPDTYRFTRFLRHHLPRCGANNVTEMGAGSGAGGIVAARRKPGARITFVDINPKALRLARVNAAVASVDVDIHVSDRIPEGSDLIIANPPYMMDSSRRTYRDGGRMSGGEVAFDWVGQSLEVLSPGGTLLLYTGAAVIDGEAPLRAAIETLSRTAGASLTIEEIDPDIFGEELERPQYQEVERIAAIGVIIQKR